MPFSVSSLVTVVSSFASREENGVYVCALKLETNEHSKRPSNLENVICQNYVYPACKNIPEYS